jgi:hypothetical protein
MLDQKFLPHVGYGICNISATWDNLDKCLRRIYWQLVPSGGVGGSAAAPLRQLDRGFYGIGCPHPGIECLVAQITKLLVHYGCQSGIGIEMQVSMELFLTELGISAQLLQESYVRYGKWIMGTWLKSIWEKVDKFHITVEIAPLPVCPPRAGDKWFMQAAMEAGVTDPNKQRILNQFRCHQHILYVSDVLNAGVKCLNKNTLTVRSQTSYGRLFNSLKRNLLTSIFISGDRCLTLLPLDDGLQIGLGALSPRATRSGSGNTTKTS